MPRRRRPVEHEHHERWAIPYGDLITLLLAFFVIMYALSVVDVGRYQVVSDALQASLRSTPQAASPVQIGSPAELEQALAAIEANLRTRQTLQPVAAPDPVREAGILRAMEADSFDASEQQAAIARLQQQLQEALSELDGDYAPRLINRGMWLELEIRNRGLFETASAQLSRSAGEFFADLANTLEPLPVRFRVEGHSDDRSIATARYPSNWELSSARAASVVRLMAEQGVAGERMVAMGYADSRPVADNTDPEGREANRRVVLVIVRRGEAEATEAGLEAIGEGL